MQILPRILLRVHRDDLEAFQARLSPLSSVLAREQVNHYSPARLPPSSKSPVEWTPAICFALVRDPHHVGQHLLWQLREPRSPPFFIVGCPLRCSGRVQEVQELHRCLPVHNRTARSQPAVQFSQPAMLNTASLACPIDHETSLHQRPQWHYWLHRFLCQQGDRVLVLIHHRRATRQLHFALHQPV